MREKLVAGFYGALSWAVWGVTICGILFLMFLLCTGNARRPTVTVEAAEIAAAQTDDPALARLNVSPAGWYTLKLELALRGSPWSPCDYRADGFHVTAPDALREQYDFFIAAPEKLVFSWASPVKTSLTLYVRHEGDPAALEALLRGARFSFYDLSQQLGFIRGRVWFDMPSFSLADFPGAPVESAL